MADVTQQQAHYRLGQPMTQCGVCSMYMHGSDGGQFGSCTKVEGNITPYGLCDYYNMLRNPYGHKLTGRDRRMMAQVYNNARARP